MFHTPVQAAYNERLSSCLTKLGMVWGGIFRVVDDIIISTHTKKAKEGKEINIQLFFTIWNFYNKLSSSLLLLLLLLLRIIIYHSFIYLFIHYSYYAESVVQFDPILDGTDFMHNLCQSKPNSIKNKCSLHLTASRSRTHTKREQRKKKREEKKYSIIFNLLNLLLWIITSTTTTTTTTNYYYHFFICSFLLKQYRRYGPIWKPFIASPKQASKANAHSTWPLQGRTLILRERKEREERKY